MKIYDFGKNDIENFIKIIEKNINMKNSFLEANNEVDKTNHKISQNKNLENKQKEFNKSEKNKRFSVSEDIFQKIH